jgi:hypothetical protein
MDVGKFLSSGPKEPIFSSYLSARCKANRNKGARSLPEYLSIAQRFSEFLAEAAGILDRGEKYWPLVATKAIGQTKNFIKKQGLALKDIGGGEQRGRSVALVIMGLVPARPGFIGKPGWVRSRAWIWLFSSTDRTMAWSGGSI